MVLLRRDHEHRLTADRTPENSTEVDNSASRVPAHNGNRRGDRGGATQQPYTNSIDVSRFGPSRPAVHVLNVVRCIPTEVDGFPVKGESEGPFIDNSPRQDWTEGRPFTY